MRYNEDTSADGRPLDLNLRDRTQHNRRIKCRTHVDHEPAQPLYSLRFRTTSMYLVILRIDKPAASASAIQEP